MSKDRKSNRESKKEPQKTLMEKRAAKKSKNDDKPFLINDGPARKPAGAPGSRQK